MNELINVYGVWAIQFLQRLKGGGWYSSLALFNLGDEQLEAITCDSEVDVERILQELQSLGVVRSTEVEGVRVYKWRPTIREELG